MIKFQLDARLQIIILNSQLELNDIGGKLSINIPGFFDLNSELHK